MPFSTIHASVYPSPLASTVISVHCALWTLVLRFVCACQTLIEQNLATTASNFTTRNRYRWTNCWKSYWNLFLHPCSVAGSFDLFSSYLHRVLTERRMRASKLTVCDVNLFNSELICYMSALCVSCERCVCANVASSISVWSWFR